MQDTRDTLIQTLRERIVEFGERNLYLLEEQEFQNGLRYNVFQSVEAPVDEHDGTETQRVVFEGSSFAVVRELTGHAN